MRIPRSRLNSARAVRSRRFVRWSGKRASLGLISAVSLFALAVPATALADGTVRLATADSYAVLGAATVTNTGPSVIHGDLGLYPGTSVTGFSSAPTDGHVYGATYINDAQARQARADLSNAYGVAAGLAPTAPEVTVPADIGGQKLVPGVYKYASSLAVTGTLTLNGEGNPNAVFVFQAGSTLGTATDSHISFINGAQPCHVFWQVGSSATLGTDSVFAGNILAYTSVSVDAGVTVDGRVLAGARDITGAVTLIDDTITRADCSTAGTGGTGGAGGTTTGGTAGSPTTGGTGTPIGSKSTSAAGKRREAKAKARAKRARAKARARARARARKLALGRGSHPARPPITTGGFTG